MRGLNLSKFKKMAEDHASATLVHADGHSLIISKGSLPALHRKQLESLQMHKYADGGEIVEDNGEDQDSGDDNEDLNVSLSDPGRSPASESVVAPDSKIEVEPISPNEEKVSTPVSAASTQPAEAVKSPTTVAPPVVAQSIGQAHNQGLQEEKTANLAGAKASQEESKQEVAAYNEAQAKLAKLPSQQDIIAANKNASDQLFKAYQNKELNPDHYWDNHSKITAGIGVLLSGVGQVLGAKSNGALDAINKGIHDDIESQKNSQDKSMNLWKMNREALGSDLAANLATQNQLYTGLKFKIDQAAAQAKGPIALANAQAANARIDQTIGANNYKLSLLSPTSDNQDPANLVQALVPEGRQAEVIREINAAKNTVANADGIFEAFDQAAKDSRPLTGGINTSLRTFDPREGKKTPGQAALQVRLGPTFSDIEGTVRQSAMDNVDHNTSPQLFDPDSTVATRRESLGHYMRGKSAASASKSFGIDLTKFPMTDTSQIGLPKKTVKQGNYTYTLNKTTGKYE